MLTLYAYQKGNEFNRIEDLDRISELITQPGSIVWLDALDPDRKEMDFLAEEFGFHPLAIDDFFTPHMRPKINEFPGYYFMVTQTISYDSDSAEIAITEFDLFVGKNYIVTIHEQPNPILDKVAGTWQKDPRLIGEGSGMLLYDILDGLVDSYFPILDQIEDQLDTIEDEIFAQGAGASAELVFRTRRSLLEFRRTATPLRDVLNTLVRRDQPLLSEQSVTYLRDVYDHMLRVVDSIDTYRDILTGALDAYLTVISNQLNNVMKTLTVVATILISVTVITGIYGMNFKYMPEIRWQYGYPFALGLMAVISLALLYYFRRIKWL